MKFREDPLLEVDMSIRCIQELERLNRQMAYYKSWIRERMKFIRHPEMTLPEPHPPGGKPVKPPEPRLTLKDRIPLRKSEQKLAYEKACEDYNSRLKDYYIKYRAYEKACDRFKEALAKWESEKEVLFSRSQADVKQARKNIKKGNRLINRYLEVLQYSQFHPDYQEIDILEKIKFYLETGRASSIQECINLYELDKSWEKVRGGQERLEHQLTATIHYLQNDLMQATSQAACTQEPIAEPPAPKRRKIKLIPFRSKKKEKPIPEFRIRHLPPAFFSGKLGSLRYRLTRLRFF